MPALAALLFLLIALDLHQKVEQGQLLPGNAPLRGLDALRATHDLTAEMLLPSGEILALDQAGSGAHAAVRLVILAPDGRSGRVLFQGAPGQGLVGGVSDGGRTYDIHGREGIHHLDVVTGQTSVTPAPEGFLEDLEAGWTVSRVDRGNGRFAVRLYRGERLCYEFRGRGSLQAARLSTDGDTLGLLTGGRLRLVPLDGGMATVDVALDRPVRADLLVSDSGRHAMVARTDGQGIGVVTPAGVTWYHLPLPWAGQPLEAGLGELDPASGRFAVTDGRRLYLGEAGQPGLQEAAATHGSSDLLHLGEWTRARGLLFTVLRSGPSPDGLHLLDPETGDLASLPLEPTCLRTLDKATPLARD